MPVFSSEPARGLDPDHRRLRAHAAVLDAPRAVARIRTGHPDRGARMRRQRPRLFPRPGRTRRFGNTARSVACAGPACASPTCSRNAIRCRNAVYTGHYSPDLNLDGKRPGDLARPADRKGVRAGNARRLCDERRADPAAARRTVAAGRARLSRLGLAEMAHAHRHPRSRARRRAHDRPALPAAAHARPLWRTAR